LFVCVPSRTALDSLQTLGVVSFAFKSFLDYLNQGPIRNNTNNNTDGLTKSKQALFLGIQSSMIPILLLLNVFLVDPAERQYQMSMAANNANAMFLPASL
jgi:hypothetical protein